MAGEISERCGPSRPAGPGRLPVDRTTGDGPHPAARARSESHPGVRCRDARPMVGSSVLGSFASQGRGSGRGSAMSSEIQAAATLDDLYRVEGKAELIGGRIVHVMPTGFRPGRVAARIFRALDDHAEATGRGVALPDNVGFAVAELSSGRQSFSPDAAYYLGALPSNPMRFIEGPPTFAVEIRSENDYGDAAEAEMAAKRADYFEAG